MYISPTLMVRSIWLIQPLQNYEYALDYCDDINENGVHKYSWLLYYAVLLSVVRSQLDVNYIPMIENIKAWLSHYVN